MILEALVPHAEQGNPSPIDDYWYEPIGPGTLTGANVSPETAIRLAVVFACVRNIAEDIGKLPAHVYERLPNDKGKRKVPNHPLYDIIHTAPNDQDTSMAWRENQQAHQLLRGNGINQIMPGPRGFADQIIPIPTDKVIIEELDGRRLRFKITERNGSSRTLVQDEVLHLRGLSLNSLTGVSAITYAAETIGLAQAAQGYAATFFGNSAIPRVVLKHPGELKTEARQGLIESWERAFGGFARSNKTAVLQEGMEIEQLTINAKDAQFIENREFDIPEICRIFRMPPHKVAFLKQATFSNIEQQSIEYVVDCLLPWVVRWEQTLAKTLILRPQTYFIGFVLSGLLRGDAKTRSEFYQSAINWGYLTRNEVRRLEDYNAIEGLDEPLQPLNMTTTSGQQNPGHGGAGSAETINAWLQDCAARCARTEVREYQKQFGDKHEDECSDGNRTNHNRFFDHHTGYMRKTLWPLFESVNRIEKLDQVIAEYATTPTGSETIEKQQALVRIASKALIY